MTKILIACEESQAVCKAFRNIGIEAFSCDTKECSGDHPEWHLQGDVTRIFHLPWWTAVIAFPPCTHLCSSGARAFAQKRLDGRQQQGIDFFMKFVNLSCKYSSIENPIGIMSNEYRKPDQIVQPHWFGHAYTKKTCLWLKGLPLLKPTNIVEPEFVIGKRDGKRYSKHHYSTSTSKGGRENRSTIRSKTPIGLAEAMAEQWGPLFKPSPRDS